MVVAQFGDGSLLPVPQPDDDVTDAIIAVAEPGAVVSRTAENPPNERFAVTVPGTSGQTNDPDLVSTELVNGGDSDLMLFTYDGQIDPRDRNNCYAIFSNTETAVAEADDILVTGPNTLQVEFDATFSDVTELVVGGADDGGCVADANDDEDSTQGAKPAGGNVGAQATGYSTGPDAQALTINRTTDQAIVRLDQKTDPSTWNLSCIHLVGPNGANITSPTQGTVPSAGPGPAAADARLRGQRDPRGHCRHPLRRRFRLATRAARLWTFDYDKVPAPTRRPEVRRREERRPGVRRRRACPSVAASTRGSSSRSGRPSGRPLVVVRVAVRRRKKRSAARGA